MTILIIQGSGTDKDNYFVGIFNEARVSKLGFLHPEEQ
jgi:hypothetical protein